MSGISVLKRAPRSLAVLLIALVAAVLVAQSALAAPPEESSAGGNGTGAILDAIAAIDARLTQIEDDNNARLDDIDAALLALASQAGDNAELLGIRLDTQDNAHADLALQAGDNAELLGIRLDTQDNAHADLALQAGDNAELLGDDLDDVHGWVDGLANPDPFNVTVNTCANVGGIGELGAEFSAEAQSDLRGSAGADAYGNGATAGVKVEGSAALKLDILGSVAFTHEVCNVGVYLPYEKDHTEQQEQAITDYTEVAVAVQNPGELVIMASEFGLDISDMAAAMDGLAGLGELAADPTSLFTGDGDVGDLVAAISYGDLMDTDSLLAAFTDPCDATTGLGAAASDICSAIDTTLADAVLLTQTTVDGMELVVDEIALGIDYTVDAVDDIIDTVTDIDAATESIEDIVDGIESSVSTIISKINSLSSDLDAFCEMTDDIGWLLGWFDFADVDCPING